MHTVFPPTVHILCTYACFVRIYSFLISPIRGSEAGVVTNCAHSVHICLYYAYIFILHEYMHVICIFPPTVHILCTYACFMRIYSFLFYPSAAA